MEPTKTTFRAIQDDQGTVESFYLEKSSGDASLDEMATRIFKEHLANRPADPEGRRIHAAVSFKKTED